MKLLNTRTLPIHHSNSFAEARDLFLADVRAWVVDCIERYADATPTNVHDQGTFTTAWEPYIRLTGDEEALLFMQQSGRKIRDHFTDTDQWRHGYWRLQEAHHGTEHFELFHGSLLRLAPDDAASNAILLDAAEHFGNWNPDVAPWFDWDGGLFYSSFFGTDGLRQEPGMELNIPDHLRCVSIALLAYQASPEQRYLDLATTHAGQWADVILAKESLPIGLNRSGPIHKFSAEDEQVYYSFIGEGKAVQSDVDRAESFLSSNTTGALMALWTLTGETRFRSATERLLDPLSTQLKDASSGAASDAIRTYRRATGDHRYDQAVLDAVSEANSREVQSITLDPTKRYKDRPAGIGKRSDMPTWLEDDKPRQVNPITLSVAAEILEDEVVAIGALDLGRTYFELACQNFPDGREHGCAAQTVSAIARGHGRDNHAGVTTAVLGPLCEAFASA